MTDRACEPSGPDIGVAQLNGDEWTRADGMTTAGSVESGAPPASCSARRLPNAPPCTAATCLAPSANTWVRGYPNVLYGINQCHTVTSPVEIPLLLLPMRVSKIPSDLIGVTAYSSQNSAVTYTSRMTFGSTPRTRRSPAGPMEPWKSWSGPTMTGAPYYPSMEVTTASIPFATRGVVETGKDAWSDYVSDVYRGGQTAPWGGAVWLVLNQADVVSKGSVSVDLSSVLSAVGAGS